MSVRAKENEMREPTFTVRRSTSTQDGSCNFCRRYTTTSGMTQHAVTLVEGRHNGAIEVRFCDVCLELFHERTK